MRVCGFTSEPGLGRLAGVRGALVLLVVAVVLVASPTAGAKRKDHTPPTYAGRKSAMTCVPGPTGGGRTTSYTLTWDAATDSVSPSSTIVYLVYQANAPGSEDFSTPTYTTAAGVTSFATPPLPAEKPVYFVVRAQDQAGNIDRNTVEQEGQNLCV
jgi:hypothetical protein